MSKIFSKKGLLIFLILLPLLFFLLYINRDRIVPLFFAQQTPQGVDEGVKTEKLEEGEMEVVLDNLDIPWEIAFISTEEFLVSQRPGTLLHVKNGQIETINITDVEHIGEGGLLGMALDPQFDENNYVYLYFTVDDSNGITNTVLRYTFEGTALTDEYTVLDNIPGARTHNGGRIAFGPDGYLYITTGDAQEVNLSQDIDSLAGKILRVTAKGDIPEDNPFGTDVYSYGHRNPQGIMWDSEGNLWSTEHGPTARDELNLILPGENYGWPEIIGDEEQEGMLTPVLHSGNNYTWAPSGGVYWDGSIFFGGLRGSAVYEARLGENNEVSEFLIHFEGEFGRVRNVQLGPDGMMYLLTNNTDGRGTPEESDDRIIRFNPSMFR